MALKRVLISSAIIVSASMTGSAAYANPPAACVDAQRPVVFPDSQPRTLAPADLKALLARSEAGAETLEARLRGDGAVVVDERTAVVQTPKGPVAVRLIDAMSPVDRDLSDPSHFFYDDGVDTMTVEGRVTQGDTMVISVLRTITNMTGDSTSAVETTHLVDPKTGGILAALRCYNESGPTTPTWAREGKGWRVDMCGTSFEVGDALIKTCATKPNKGLSAARGWVRKMDALITKGDEKSLAQAARTLAYIAEVWAPTRETLGEVPDMWLNLARTHAKGALARFGFANPVTAELAYRNAAGGSRDAEYLGKVAMEAAMAVVGEAMTDPGSADDFLAPSQDSLIEDLEGAIRLFEIARGHGGPAHIIDEFVKVASERIKQLKSMVEAP
jgi:hypothetical protein